MPKSLLLISANVNAINLMISRWHSRFRVGLKSNNLCSYKKRQGERNLRNKTARWKWRLGSSSSHLFYTGRSKRVQTCCCGKGRRTRVKVTPANPLRPGHGNSTLTFLLYSTGTTKSKAWRNALYSCSGRSCKRTWIQRDLLKQTSNTAYHTWLHSATHSHIFCCISGHFFFFLQTLRSSFSSLNLESMDCPWASSLNPFSFLYTYSV